MIRKVPSEFLLIIGLSILMIGFGCSVRDSEDRLGYCPPIPASFSPEQLNGTWLAENENASDRLIIREDGMYKQIITIQDLDIEYVSDWHSWRMENSKSQFPAIYFDDYRVCASMPIHSCEWVSDGSSSWTNYCGGRTTQYPPGEIALYLTGYPDYVETDLSNDVRLVLFLGFESSPWIYHLQE